MGKFPEIEELVNARLQDLPEEKENRVLLWQRAAMEDGFDFPRFGADGLWGAECESVARLAVVRCRGIYRFPHLTKLVQKWVGAEPDGLCGPRTEAAIRAYQQAHGLTEDGAAGINTYKQLLGVGK